MLFLKFVIYFSLLFIVYQDFKFKAVSAWIFVVLLIALSLKIYKEDGLQILLNNLKYNLLFIFSQFLLLTVYFSIKAKIIKNVFKEFIGIGDLIFLISIAVYFNVYSFVVFYILSLIFTLALKLIMNIFSKSQTRLIPLAGFQAAFLILFTLLIDFNFFSVQSLETWMYNQLI